MIRVLERLRKDHIHAASLVNILADGMEQVRDGRNADFELMSDVMRYLMRFNDTVHHPCEDLLYARMADKSKALAKQFAGLGDEHSRLIKMGKILSERLSMIADGSMTPREEILALGNEYVSEFRQHMTLEERSLFPMIEQHLDNADSEEVFQILEAQQDPVFGPILDADFDALYEHIQMLKGA